MRVLTIGNSFTGNATKYLQEIIDDGALPMEFRRAIIGGKSMQTHAENLASGEALYGGKALGELIDMGWDAITLQNHSWKSAVFEEWQPWTDKIVAYIRKVNPQTKIVFYQTWGYHTENPRLVSDLGGMTQAEMLAAIKDNCERLADKYDGGNIPVGEAFRLTQELTGDACGEFARLNDGSSHANPLGEYLAGMIFWSYFTGGDVDNLNFIPEAVDSAQAEIAKKAAKLALKTAK